MRDEKRIMELSGIIRQTGFDLHCYLPHGHLEKVYENGLAHRLRKQHLKVIQQHPLEVHDEDGALLGNFFADLYVEGRLLVELKACKSLAPEHFAPPSIVMPC